jgi:F-type H+-transporting ATPase subunit epsilon
VTIPTASGEAGILSNHAPLVSALKPGILSYAGKGGSEKMVVTGGFVEVSNNQVSVLTDSAESAADIDIDAAKADREAAEKELAAAAANDIETTSIWRERVEAANARIQLAASR